MTAIEELKKDLNEHFGAKVFPTYLKAISEMSETSKELKERIKGAGFFRANFAISEANVEAHIESKLEVSNSGGEGLYKNPDITSVMTEEAAKEAILCTSVSSLWTRGVTTGIIKVSDMGVAMKKMPILKIIDETLEAFYGYKSKENMPENVEKIIKARDLGECDVNLFIPWLKASEEIDGEFMEHIKEKYAKIAETSRFNYKIPSAGINGHYGIVVKRYLSGGDGNLDAPDFTLELSEDIVKELMTGKIGLGTAYNAGFIKVERKNVGKLMAIDSIFSIANEELGINK